MEGRGVRSIWGVRHSDFSSSLRRLFRTSRCSGCRPTLPSGEVQSQEQIGGPYTTSVNPGNEEEGSLGVCRDPRSPNNRSRGLSLRSQDQRFPLLPNPSPETSPYTAYDKDSSSPSTTNGPITSKTTRREGPPLTPEKGSTENRFYVSFVWSLRPVSVSFTVHHDEGFPVTAPTRHRDSTNPTGGPRHSTGPSGPSRDTRENFQVKTT